MSIQIKRIYDPVEEDDGQRILVDRLWPRGVSKERAHLSQWMKDAAPSGELRQWFGHEPARMDDFAACYRRELSRDAEKRQAVQELLALDAEGPVTLLYAAKSPTVNHAAVLRDFLQMKEKEAE